MEGRLPPPHLHDVYRALFNAFGVFFARPCPRKHSQVVPSIQGGHVVRVGSRLRGVDILLATLRALASFVDMSKSHDCRGLRTREISHHLLITHACMPLLQIPSSRPSRVSRFCPPPQPTQPMTEKVDIYRMGMVFKKYLANGGVHFLGHDGGASDFDIAEHTRYNMVSYSLCGDPSLVVFLLEQVYGCTGSPP